jgi:NifU-like protein involved in Fe-S cluster formation
MACVENVLRESGYSSKAIDLYLNKVNVGTCDDANICFGYTGPCGDTMEIFLYVDPNRIRDAKFQAIGCEGAFICGSAVTEMIKGMTVDQAENIEKDQVIAYLGGLPEEKYDCACLAVRTLRETLQKFKKHQS